MHAQCIERTHLWVGCICLEYALYVLAVTLGMSGPICEWAVSALSVHYMFLLSLSAWVDPSESGLHLPWVCIILFSCCHSRHEWTHLWVGCICLECALYVLCAQHTHTHTRTHTPAFTHLEWCRPHEQFFGGWVYIPVDNIAPSIYDRREPQRRPGTNKHHTLHTTRAPTQLQSTSIPQ